MSVNEFFDVREVVVLGEKRIERDNEFFDVREVVVPGEKRIERDRR